MIALVGYMGSGKSTIGKALAKKLKFDFVDLDTIIEKNENKSISAIFSLYGDYYFRKKEYLNLKDQLEKLGKKTVLALGGGSPVYYNSMELINEKSTSFYIKVDPTELSHRLMKNKRDRPVIADKNENELQEFIKEQLNYREFFYKKAQHTITDMNIESILSSIENLYCKE